MSYLVFNDEQLKDITKPIEVIEIFEDYENYLIDVGNYKSNLNYNDDLITRMLYISQHYDKSYKIKTKTSYKYFDKSNNYLDILQCHVEFIILKYMFVTELQSECYYFSNNTKPRRQFLQQYKKIEKIFNELSSHDAYLLCSIIFNDLRMLMEYIDFNGLTSNIGDYCDCIIDLLLLISNSYYKAGLNTELSYNLTYFLLINPDFKLAKIINLQKIYTFNFKIKLLPIYKVDININHDFDLPLYVYNILQIEQSRKKLGLLYEKNQKEFLLEILIKSILDKLPNISCLLMRKMISDVKKIDIDKGFYFVQNSDNSDVWIYLNNFCIYRSFKWYYMQNGINYFHDKYPLGKKLKHETDNSRVYIKAFTRLLNNYANNYNRPFIIYDYNNYGTNRDDEGDDSDGNDVNIVKMFGHDECGNKIINFNPRSKNYKKSKSRYINKSRSKLRKKNKFKIKNMIRSLNY